MLIRLHGCAGWSAPLLFAYGIRHIFAWPGPNHLIFSLTQHRILSESRSYPNHWKGSAHLYSELKGSHCFYPGSVEVVWNTRLLAECSYIFWVTRQILLHWNKHVWSLLLHWNKHVWSLLLHWNKHVWSLLLHWNKHVWSLLLHWNKHVWSLLLHWNKRVITITALKQTCVITIFTFPYDSMENCHRKCPSNTLENHKNHRFSMS